jgi:hypothetical protein
MTYLFRLFLLFGIPPWLAACGGMAVAEGPAFAEACVRSVGVGGQAHRCAGADGQVRGGHLSGGRPPSFHQQTGELAADDRPALARLAAAARREAGPLPAEPGTGYQEVSVTYVDGSHVGERVTGDGKFASPALNEIAGLLGRYRIGGW